MDVLTGSCESIFYYIVKYDNFIIYLYLFIVYSFIYFRDCPQDLKAIGDITVKACQVKSRFFHCEFFRTAGIYLSNILFSFSPLLLFSFFELVRKLIIILDGNLIPLEINLRPPGGITVGIFIFYSIFLFSKKDQEII